MEDSLDFKKVCNIKKTLNILFVKKIIRRIHYDDYYFNFIGYAVKECTENGEWWAPMNKTESFSHYHMCNDQEEITVKYYSL